MDGVLELDFSINKTWEQSKQLYRKNKQEFFDAVTETSGHVPVHCEDENWLFNKKESCVLWTADNKAGVLSFQRRS